MARTGYLIKVYKDINPSSSTYNYVREERIKDDETCGVQEPKYRWVVIEGSFVCSGYDKYSIEKHQVSYDNGSTWEDTDEPTITGSVIERNSEDCGYSPTPTPSDYSSQYFTIESLEDSNDIKIKPPTTDSFMITPLYYSTDGGTTWNKFDEYCSGATLIATIGKGQKMLLKANRTQYGTVDNEYTFVTTKSFNVYGNIMSLLYNDIFEGEEELIHEGNFHGFFKGCTGLVSAENLILPKYLKENDFLGMFRGCTSLVKAPALTAVKPGRSSYQSMFMDCSSLKYIKCLATDISARYCTTYWVSGVSSTGTFVKSASMSDWTTGTSGIPKGWTVIDE